MIRNTIITISRRCTIGVLILGWIIAGCARLPDYATPHSAAAGPDPALLAEAITYRALQRTDFRARELPPAMAAHADDINAFTCARIRPAADARMAVRRVRYGDTWVHIGTIEGLRFEAVMIPGCSWWNPDLPERQWAYVLQHEQIHFGLLEVSARRLTADVRERAAALLAIQPTAAAARDEVAQTVNNWIHSAMDQALAEHTAFDEETSLFHSPRRQQWWLEKVDDALAAPPTPVSSAAGDQPAGRTGTTAVKTR